MIDIERILDEISVLPELKQQVSSKQIMLQTVEGCTDPYFGTGYIYQFSKGGVHVQGDYKDLQNVKKLFEDSNWHFINSRDDNFDMIKKFIDKELDIIYLDTIHKADHVEKIIYSYYDKLKVGGFFFHRRHLLATLHKI